MSERFQKNSAWKPKINGNNAAASDAAHDRGKGHLAVSAAASTLSAELNHCMSAMRSLAQRASENIGPPEETLESSDYLINVARHSHATKAFLQVMYENDSLILQVIDNGVGFQVPESPGEFAPSGHFGLLGLYKRAELIGASLNIKSEAGKGTQLTIQLPFQGKEMEVNK